MSTHLSPDLVKPAEEVAKKLVASNETSMPVPGAPGMSVSKTKDNMLVVQLIKIRRVTEDQKIIDTTLYVDVIVDL